MWTVIDGLDLTNNIPRETIHFSQTQNDPQPSASLDVRDVGSLMTFQVGMEIIIWDEYAPPTYTFSGRVVPTVPAHNLVQGFNVAQWSKTGTISSTITGSLFPNQTFSNNIVGTGVLVASSFAGYVRAGQQYMLSVYANIATPLVNALALLQIDFLDGSGNIIGGSTVSTTFSSTTENKQQRISISGIAPTGAVAIKATVGGQTTSTTNSGTINWGTPQLEPMWFRALERGVSYPTPDCNNAQVNSATMPDGTISRACRIFSGTIDDWTIDYDGVNRTWHLSLSGPGAQLENGQVNASFTSFTDKDILTSVVNTYFSGLLSINAPNTSSALPLQVGVTIDNIGFSDNSLREVCNSLTEQSGYSSSVDPYYRLRYNPQYYNAAPWTLTSGTPDNITSFNTYDFHPEQDGTQRKKRIKVVGGKFLAPAISDTFSGDGVTKVFNLSNQPYNVQPVTIGGVVQKTGVAGVNTLGVGGVVALIDKVAKTLTFATAPVAGTNNVVCTYTYEAPVSVLVQNIDTSDDPVVPGYAKPLYDSKVSDTNILSIAAATQRGLAEISRSGPVKNILRLKASQYAQAGYTVFVTDLQSGINNQPYIVQSVSGSYLGNGLNEYQYQLGPYQPTLVDHIRNANKASNRSSTTANVTAPQQINLVADETLQYSDSISATVQPSYAQGVYGTAHYGQNVYGGSTGVYGTALYGMSNIYG